MGKKKGTVLPAGWQKGKELGEGGFGKVFRCQDRYRRDLPYAAKVISIMGERMIKEIAKEVTLLQRLSHPNIIRYFECTVLEHNTFCIVMEYASGGSMKELIKKTSGLPEERVRRYTRQIVLGLTYLHSENIIHRDIKPANILLDGKDTVRLADLGISKMLNPTGTMSGQVTSQEGTLIYMSPEILREEGYGRKTDVWSLGCTVVEMLTGNPPWHTLKTFELIQKITSKEHPSYSLPSGTSAEGKDILKRCFRRDKATRPYAADLLEHDFCKEGYRRRRRLCSIM